MLAHAEIRFDPLPFQSVRRPEPCKSNSLLEEGNIRHLAAHEHAFFEGDTESHIYRIEAGLMRLYRSLADGRRQIIAFRSAGDVIGIGSHGKQFCSAEAVTTVTLRSLPLSVAHRRIREDPFFQSEYVKSIDQRAGGGAAAACDAEQAIGIRKSCCLHSGSLTT